jgi:hypothetical protein
MNEYFSKVHGINTVKTKHSTFALKKQHKNRNFVSNIILSTISGVLDPEDGGTTFLQNMCSCLPLDTVGP